jgi:hypothetical protein
MAHYVAHIRSARTVEHAFAYLADLTNFQEWDPGVITARQVIGEGPGAGAAFDVAVKGIPRPLTLRYHLVAFEAPNQVVARAESKLLTSLDTITVQADGDGSIVTYEAELTLNGPLGVADPLLGIAFGRIGDRAAEGLGRALDGHRVAEPA